jgi:hypothetical protein
MSVKSHVTCPRLASQGVPSTTSTSLLMSRRNASMSKASLPMRNDTLKEAPRQVTSLPLLTRMLVLMRCS